MRLRSLSPLVLNSHPHKATQLHCLRVPFNLPFAAGPFLSRRHQLRRWAWSSGNRLLCSTLFARSNLWWGIRAFPIENLQISRTQLRMQSREGKESFKKIVNSTPKVDKIQEVLNRDSTGGWEKCWEEGLTPWDLGQPTPVLLHLHQTGALPKGRALVPGCGSGHDVVAIACPERYVVGLDISDNAVKKATELSSSLPNANYLTFIKADFFTLHPAELFDLIFDYTFFCAIEPHMRSAWASQVRDILKPDGELITLIFPISDHVGGPPYKVSVADYEEVLHPMGFKAISIVDNELAIGPRKGREKLGRWKRSPNRSLL